MITTSTTVSATVTHIESECTRATSARLNPLRVTAPSPECGPEPLVTVPRYIITMDAQNTAWVSSQGSCGTSVATRP